MAFGGYFCRLSDIQGRKWLLYRPVNDIEGFFYHCREQPCFCGLNPLGKVQSCSLRLSTVQGIISSLTQNNRHQVLFSIFMPVGLYFFL